MVTPGLKREFLYALRGAAGLIGVSSAAVALALPLYFSGGGSLWTLDGNYQTAIAAFVAGLALALASSAIVTRVEYAIIDLGREQSGLKPK
ncbi:MAG: hypothetical protein ACRED5_03725 [Propylenella sp.]